jgi:hypothetical protein
MARPREPSPRQDKWGWAGDFDSRPLAAIRPFMLGGSQRRGPRVPGFERNRATGQLMPIVGLVTRRPCVPKLACQRPGGDGGCAVPKSRPRDAEPAGRGPDRLS